MGSQLRTQGVCGAHYGYSATVHKAQGARVDNIFMLATPGMDRQQAYVGMTRHREDVEVHVGHDDFTSMN